MPKGWGMGMGLMYIDLYVCDIYLIIYMIYIYMIYRSTYSCIPICICIYIYIFELIYSYLSSR